MQDRERLKANSNIAGRVDLMVPAKSPQLLLGVHLKGDATFANFLVGKKNSQVLEFLQHWPTNIKESFVYMWGLNATGRTHLLQAMCHREEAAGRSSIYIPLWEHDELKPEILHGLEDLSLVCIDDIDTIAGDNEWEQALFQFYNSARERDVKVLVTATVPAGQLQLGLADLQSRLQWGLTYQLQEIEDQEKLELLADQVGSFIWQRSARSSKALMEVLNRLDQRSLEEKRRITIPLVKELMNW
jgi:DnaA-homolog protein